MGNVKRLFMGWGAPQGDWTSEIPLVLWHQAGLWRRRWVFCLGWLRKNTGSLLRKPLTFTLHWAPRGDKFCLRAPVSLWRVILLQVLEVSCFAFYYGGRINQTWFLIRCGKRLNVVNEESYDCERVKERMKEYIFSGKWGGERAAEVQDANPQESLTSGLPSKSSPPSITDMAYVKGTSCKFLSVWRMKGPRLVLPSRGTEHSLYAFPPTWNCWKDFSSTKLHS